MTLLASVVNSIALGVALWLGLYIVTRSQRRIAWLAAGTLWSLAFYFLGRFANLNFPTQITLPAGWGATLAAVLWYHLSTEFEPRLPRRRLWLPLTYTMAGLFLILLNRTDLVFVGPSGGSNILTAQAPIGPLYPLLAVFLMTWPLLSLWNFRAAERASHPALRGQMTAFVRATVAATFGVVYLVGADAVRLVLPTVIGDLALGLAVALLGYAVARYNATLEGRSANADLPYTLAAMVLIILSYLVVAWVSHSLYGIPLAALALLFLLVLISHTLYDGFRGQLDRFFYHRPAARLRRELRHLMQEVDGDKALAEALQATLAAACASVEAESGLIALQQSTGLIVVASVRAAPPGHMLAEVTLPDEAMLLDHPLPALGDMVAVAPIVWAGAPLGLVAIGSRPGGYAVADLGALIMLADRIAGVAYAAQVTAAATEALNVQIEAFRIREHELRREVLALTQSAALDALDANEAELTRLVEDALRHLYDFAYLGQHALARWHVVENAWSEYGEATLLERGQALRDTLVRTIERLRPPGSQPSDNAIAARREWHAYVILYESYIDNKSTRDTMNRLGISEGTYNRTRKHALLGVAQALAEIEHASRSALHVASTEIEAG